MTCSIGVASSENPPAEGSESQWGCKTCDALLTSADQAMYAAKRLGWYQVRAAGDPAVTQLLDRDQEVASREDMALSGTVEALVALGKSENPRAGEPAKAAALLSADLARALGLTAVESRQIGLAARLHHIGLAGASDARDTHTDVSADVVSHAPSLRPLAPLVCAHHEHRDGSGFPNALAG